MTGLFWFSMGVMVTFSTIIIFRKVDTYFHNKLPFYDILKSIKRNELNFQKRLGDLVFFTGYKELLLIYNVKEHTLSLFEDEKCTLVTFDSNQKISDEIIDELETKFYTDIYRKIYVINGTVYSNNQRKPTQHKESTKERESIGVDNSEDSKPSVVFLLEEDVEGYVEEMDIEIILDKVEKNGLSSLNNEEINFIEDIDNWKVD